jgi:DNA-directed RNA polymerase subunit RPC12/RpoP
VTLPDGEGGDLVCLDCGSSNLEDIGGDLGVTCLDCEALSILAEFSRLAAECTTYQCANEAWPTHPSGLCMKCYQEYKQDLRDNLGDEGGLIE